MKFIAHRGNVNGKTDLENNPIQIAAAIQSGFDVEIDIWSQNDELYLGHDFPAYKIDIRFLENFIDNLWIHCKNHFALEFFNQSNTNFNYFWHQVDNYTLTSLGYIWVYPGVPITTGKSVAVMPETVSYKLTNLFSSYAICSDYVKVYSDIYKETILK